MHTALAASACSWTCQWNAGWRSGAHGSHAKDMALAVGSIVVLILIVVAGAAAKVRSALS